MRWGTVLVVAAGLWACDDETSGPRLIGRQDASERDARPVGDAATRDAAPADVGPGGGPDGGRDAQVPDSTVQFDAGGVDHGARDQGGEDRGPPPDAAILDAAPPPDQALPDVGPVARCGDGQVDEGEACDDGNALDGDYCAGDCRAVTGRCGDGVLQNIERCDDGRLVEGCDATHDGGDGTCLPPGQCSADFVLDGADCVARQQSAVVDIFVDNFCNMRVEPPRFAVAQGGRSRSRTATAASTTPSTSGCRTGAASSIWRRAPSGPTGSCTAPARAGRTRRRPTSPPPARSTGSSSTASSGQVRRLSTKGVAAMAPAMTSCETKPWMK
ncbi:MAG: hypothetical protein R3F43_06555 [bacterium]